MTVNQLFENAMIRKTVWTKRGGEITKRSVSALTDVRPLTKIKSVKEKGE